MLTAPGVIRDSIIGYMEALASDASIQQITEAVSLRLGPVRPSSVRSYLNLNVPDVFERTGRGRYRLTRDETTVQRLELGPVIKHGRSLLYHADCFDWLATCPEASIHAIVTDPPYGLTEYHAAELAKLRAGHGGVWRIPPAFDGHRRSPVPRFTIMTDADRRELHGFFRRLGALFSRALVPGGNVVVATNPLFQHVVASALSEGGLELRGSIARLTMTMRGGDRPKNAHVEFDGVSVMPRSQWEPWVVLRRPLDGRVQDNLRRWKTGGFRRLSAEQPFGDVIKSHPTSAIERAIAPHPSLKPQAFMRAIVRGSLPLGEGMMLDPFAGSGSTLAAAEAIGYHSIGIEADPKFVRMAEHAIPKLALLRTVDPTRA